MAKEEVCHWQANFDLDPPISLYIVQNLPDVQILRCSDDTSALFDKIEVTTRGVASYIEAHLDAVETCNRCTDFLTFIKGFPVKATLSEIRPQGSKTVCVPHDLDFVVAERHTNIDLAEETIERIIRGNDGKLNRQLSHYRRAIETDDVITKIKELYQVIEAEKDKYSQFLKKYKYVRDLLSHPEVNHPPIVQKAKDRFGRAHIDPSSPKDLDELKKDAEKLLVEAREILLRNMQL